MATVGEGVDKEEAIKLDFALLLIGLAWVVDGGGGRAECFSSILIGGVRKGLGGGGGAREGFSAGVGAGAGAGAGAVLPKSQ